VNSMEGGNITSGLESGFEREIGLGMIGSRGVWAGYEGRRDISGR
jgi:hypothetical protein